MKGASFSRDVITKYTLWQDESESEEGLVWEGLTITITISTVVSFSVFFVISFGFSSPSLSENLN